ncbi:hypothetical protein L1887_53634 [Cichorium endivia]|nr:hypothetical protein L1887_53634 [Cichorium endivia]
MLTRGRGNPPVYLPARPHARTPARSQLRPSPRTWPSVLLLCPYRLVCPPLPIPGRRCSSCSSCCYSGKPRSISVVAVRTPLLHDLERARDSPSRGSITAAPASALHERHARLADTECASPSNHTHVSPRRSNTASPTPFPSPSPNLACYLIPWLPLPLPSFRPLARIWTCPSLSLQGIRPRHLSFTTNPALLPPPPPITASSHPFVPLSRQLHRLCLRDPPCHRPSILYPAPRLVQTLLPILIPATSPIDPLHPTRPQLSVTLPVHATHPPPLRILRTRLHRPPTCRPPRILPLLPHRPPTTPPRKSPQRRAVSCEPCRRRKLKCDRGWPCGACRDRNESSKCEWAEGVRPQTTGRDTGDASQTNDRLDRLEAMMGAIAASLGVDLPGTKNSPASATLTPGVAQRKYSSSSSLSTNPGSANASTSKLSTLAELGASEANRAALAATSTRPDDAQPSYGIGPISWGFGFGISQTSQVSSEELTRRTLFELFKLLPDNSTVRALTDFYFRELSWMAHLLPEETFRKRLRNIEEQRLFWDGRPDAYRYEEMRDSLRLVATIHALCGAVLVFGEPIEADSLPEKYGKQAFTIFLDAAQHALSMLDIYEELHIDNVRTMILLSSCLSALKGPAVGSAMIANICFMAYALQLDVEPPKTLPFEERKDRISLFATICIQDWFSAGNVKRSYMIDPANTSLPSLFGPDADTNDIIAVPMRYKLKLSDVSRRASHRIRMSEDEAYEFTKQLHQEVVAIEASIPEHLRFDESLIDSDDPDNPERWHRSAMALAVQMQTAHAAQALLCAVVVFRNAFKWFTAARECHAGRAARHDRRGHAHAAQFGESRLWFFAQMSIISSLVADPLCIHARYASARALSSKSKLALGWCACDSATRVKPEQAQGRRGSGSGWRSARWWAVGKQVDGQSTDSQSELVFGIVGILEWSLRLDWHSAHRLRTTHPVRAAIARTAWRILPNSPRPKLPFDGQVAPATANSFDDIEALWQKQPWQTASLRMGTSPANQAMNRGKTRAASGSNVVGGYQGGQKAVGVGSEGTPDCPYINASFFGPDASFNDLARAEAAIGRQDASFGYPVAPLSPFTASFINSLDQYVASLEEPLPSSGPAVVAMPSASGSLAMPQSHALVQANNDAGTGA